MYIDDDDNALRTDHHTALTDALRTPWAANRTFPALLEDLVHHHHRGRHHHHQYRDGFAGGGGSYGNGAVGGDNRYKQQAALSELSKPFSKLSDNEQGRAMVSPLTGALPLGGRARGGAKASPSTAVSAAASPTGGGGGGYTASVLEAFLSRQYETAASSTAQEVPSASNVVSSTGGGNSEEIFFDSTPLQHDTYSAFSAKVMQRYFSSHGNLCFDWFHQQREENSVPKDEEGTAVNKQLKTSSIAHHLSALANCDEPWDVDDEEEDDSTAEDKHFCYNGSYAAFGESTTIIHTRQEGARNDGSTEQHSMNAPYFIDSQYASGGSQEGSSSGDGIGASFGFGGSGGKGSGEPRNSTGNDGVVVKEVTAADRARQAYIAQKVEEDVLEVEKERQAELEAERQAQQKAEGEEEAKQRAQGTKAEGTHGSHKAPQAAVVGNGVTTTTAAAGADLGIAMKTDSSEKPYTIDNDASSLVFRFGDAGGLTVTEEKKKNRATKKKGDAPPTKREKTESSAASRKDSSKKSKGPSRCITPIPEAGDEMDTECEAKIAALEAALAAVVPMELLGTVHKFPVSVRQAALLGFEVKAAASQ